MGLDVFPQIYHLRFFHIQFSLQEKAELAAIYDYDHLIGSPKHNTSILLGTWGLMHIALFEDNSMMTRLHYYDHSRLMGATYLDFIDNYGDKSRLIHAD